jgi:hypothetical protein
VHVRPLTVSPSVVVAALAAARAAASLLPLRGVQRYKGRGDSDGDTRWEQGSWGAPLASFPQRSLQGCRASMACCLPAN